MCCLRWCRTYLCGRCQYGPVICGMKYLCAGIGNNGSYCCLEMGIWSGVLLTWLVLTSLFASCARSLITTETIATELLPCVTITESLRHSERGRGMRWWILWGLYTLGIVSALFFPHCSLLRYITMNHTMISPVSYVDVSAICVCAIPFRDGLLIVCR
jgi:hypothetical protein